MERSFGPREAQKQEDGLVGMRDAIPAEKWHERQYHEVAYGAVGTHSIPASKQ